MQHGLPQRMVAAKAAPVLSASRAEVRSGILTRPRALLVLIGSLSIFGPLCIDMYLPAFPRITKDLHAGASLVQLSLTACMIGLGLGQLLIGPFSDRFGRRRPLLVGISLFILASLACALAPGIYGLVALRFFQGFGGAAGIVISRAIVRDLFADTAAARFFSMLVLVTGLGPIIAPQIGASLLRVTSWRGVFVVLAIAGSVIGVVAAFRLPETLAPEHVRSGGFSDTLHEMRLVLTDRAFLGNTLAIGLAFGAVISYVSGSSFVFENIFHLSPQAYGLVFALNACGMIGGSQLSARLVSRFGSVRLMTFALSGQAIAGLTLLIVVTSKSVGLPAIMPALFLLMTCMGCAGPNGTALALNDFPHTAGGASALMGLIQFSIGALVAPLMGVAGNHSALPMATSIAMFATAALGLRLFLTRVRKLNDPGNLESIPEIA